MHNPHLTKARLKHTDKWRALVTDTAPFEVPIIFSNDGFYKNLSELHSKSKRFQGLVEALVLADRKYTIPLRYNIVKGPTSVRTLSLLHPHGQSEIAEFYGQYDQLICEYGLRSPFSIRRPANIGKTFFFRSIFEDKNKYKGSTVDTTDIDSLVRNPASYFSYAGVDRLYKFFLSDDHVRLEKKFKHQLSLDISKCFDSIYTHSIAWAARNKDLSKDHPNALSFGNRFDTVMQRLNHNETSGICIGPEASRMFAEIILGKVDQNIERTLDSIGISVRSDYECRRYVDNYYVFANSEKTLDLVKHEISIALRDFNLHLNEEKTERLKRPFYTRKSLVIDKVNISIQNLWAKTIHNHFNAGDRIYVAKQIRRHRSVFGAFSREVKAACYASGMGYDSVSNYIVGAMKRKLVDLTEAYTSAKKLTDGSFEKLHHRQLLLLILDIGFYFFTLHPTVASSLRLSHAIVLAAQHLKDHDNEGFEIAKEYVSRWTALLVKSPTFSELFEKSTIVPIELLNVLVSLRQFSSDGSLEAELLDTGGLEDSDSHYFQIAVRLFIYRDHKSLEVRRDQVFEQACKKLISADYLTTDAESTHMLLDLLACPFVPTEKRQALLKAVWPSLKQANNNIGKITHSTAKALVREIEDQHWFISWDGVDLLNMIEKKELSAVYA